MVEENKTTQTDRTPRSASTRENKARRKPWSPPSLLDAPNPPEGYVYRWIRESMVGQQDQANMSKRIREGWEPVIGVGGLLLAKMPMETVQERREYYANLANSQMEAVDNNLMRESNSSMPISKPNRQTQVTFGKGSGFSEG